MSEDPAMGMGGLMSNDSYDDTSTVKIPSMRFRRENSQKFIMGGVESLSHSPINSPRSDFFPTTNSINNYIFI